MASSKRPKLRRIQKYNPPYLLNRFPPAFALSLGKEIVYLLASKGKPVLEGSDWEEIFANCIDASWKPSNVGLDDVVKHQCAWGAKTVKSNNPKSQRFVRLISGRNLPAYSFSQGKILGADPNKIGSMVLDIWNDRVNEVQKNFNELRTIVLVKANDLTNMVVFEIPTLAYDNSDLFWEWNDNNNLIDREKKNKFHKFTWQPHGSQFTIIEEVPQKSLFIQVRKPNTLNKDLVLDTVGFDESWITVSYTDD